MKSTLTKVQVLGLLIALPALANDVGLHKGSAQPTRAIPSNIIRTMNYGVCQFIRAENEQRDDELNKGDISQYALRPQYLAEKLLPEGLRSKFESNTLDADQLSVVFNWIDNVNVKLLQSPEHGTMLNATHYLPSTGYMGQDRVDFLLEGNDLNGQPFSLKVKYYINVVSESQLESVIKDNNSYLQALKKYCGTTAPTWPITNHDSNISNAATVYALNSLLSPRRLG